jgi:hypothetical protein
MIKTLLAALILLLSASSLFGRDQGLLTYEQFLASRGLSPDDVKCIKEQTEDVLNPMNQTWDNGRSVCEVWTKERPLTFKDGSQVYKAVREWQEAVPRTETQTVSGEFVVKQDEKTVTLPPDKKSFKRYVPKP